MRVLVACEYSGRVREAFRRRGINAISCDLLPAEDNSPLHYQGDVFDLIDKYQFDLLIAHPPCTYLANSGAKHLYTEDGRWEKLDEGAEFFKRLLNCRIARKAIENPIPHKHAIDRIGRKYDQIIQPWMFGHMEQKATCLWLENLPKLKETKNVKEQMMLLPKNQRERIHYLPPGPDRWKERSRTFQGIADAFAEQWGPLLK